jgi:formylmethanofuran dehydrogenase subunit E
MLGVRMTIAGCRTLGFEHPRQAGKRLVVIVEIDWCATDAIQALTGGESRQEHAQARGPRTAAYRTIPETRVNYEREVQAGGRVVCRACAGELYYTVAVPAPTSL